MVNEQLRSIHQQATRNARLLGATALLAIVATQAVGAESSGEKQFVEQHCVDCHDASGKSGGLDLSNAVWSLDEPADFVRWVNVFDRVVAGEMPPEDAEQPTAADRQRFADSLRNGLHRHSAARQQREGRTVLRRLNRVEFENTVHDLLDVDVPLKHLLPEDTPAHGFDNDVPPVSQHANLC